MITRPYLFIRLSPFNGEAEAVRFAHRLINTRSGGFGEMGLAGGCDAFQALLRYL
jgi:hypothetical protein